MNYPIVIGLFPATVALIGVVSTPGVLCSVASSPVCSCGCHLNGRCWLAQSISDLSVGVMQLNVARRAIPYLSLPLKWTVTRLMIVDVHLVPIGVLGLRRSRYRRLGGLSGSLWRYLILRWLWGRCSLYFRFYLRLVRPCYFTCACLSADCRSACWLFS